MPAGLLNTVEASSAREALPAKTVATPAALFSRTMNPEAALSLLPAVAPIPAITSKVGIRFMSVMPPGIGWWP
jgi:hypothetical protein